MSLSEYIRKDGIRIFEQTLEQFDLLRQLGDTLVQAGAVSNSYIDAVCERERHFPTGLYTGSVNVAIPHADPLHVKEPAIALGLARKGVLFRNMADPAADIDVQIVFLLALNKSESQLLILEQIMDLIQDQGSMQKVLEAKEEQDVLSILIEHGRTEEKR